MGPQAHAGGSPSPHTCSWSASPLSIHLPAVLTEIRSLLDRPATRAASSRAIVEKTLTDGYAHALALEGDRQRLERRLYELRVRLSEREQLDDAEIASLTSALAATERELVDLRRLLAELRAHAL